mmetsp:Transcript_1529/g.2039  ORF Transcript_1529/g.2039 Transcript_1529/m.2039 type:complete len:358 (+) Transcript_1529:99-1172(+)
MKWSRFGVVLLVTVESFVYRGGIYHKSEINERRRLDTRGFTLYATADDRDSLPLNYRSDNGTRDEEFEVSNRTLLQQKSSTALMDTRISAEEEENDYYRIVAGLTPKEMIGRFAKSAPDRVQEAVRQTIMGLLGAGGPGFAMETQTITTSERLANLMFQLQMTGYMFKNAEYRVSLSQSLDKVPALSPSEFDGHELDPLPEVRGQVKVKIAQGLEVSVDADAYMKELRDEVKELREELAKVQQSQELAIRKDLLAYIKSMPEKQLADLTSGVSSEVLDAMKKLVYSIMRGMGTANLEPDVVLQQPGSAMAQLCMWQLVIGYNLRELEVRDQLQNQLAQSSSPEPDAPSSSPGSEASS